MRYLKTALALSAVSMLGAMAYNTDLEGSNAAGGDTTTETVTATAEPEKINRPKAGSMSGLVWDTADALYTARADAGMEHPIPVSSEVSGIYMTIPGAKDPTCRAQFARWVRFNGFEQLLKDRKAAERGTKDIDPEVAAAKAAKKAEREAKKADKLAKKEARAEADKVKQEATSAYKQKLAEQAVASLAKPASDINAKNEADSQEVPESVTEGTDDGVIESLKKRNAKNK